MNGTRTPHGCISLIIFFILISLPFFMADIVLSALSRLGLSTLTAFLAAIGIFVGGLINIPVKKIPREEQFDASRFSLFGLDRLAPRFTRPLKHTIIAVNVGGCLIPTAISAYELMRLYGDGISAFLAAIAAIAVNIAVCNKFARMVPGVGIAMPSLVPAITASICAFLFMPSAAPQIAFSAGVLGPLIGADLLHLREIDKLNAGIASIGGAGTFDGIVLSGLIATLLV